VSGHFKALQSTMGRGLLMFAPFLMKLLTVVGTIAMFLVGGGIIVHSVSWLGRQLHYLELWLGQYFGSLSESILSILLNGITGIIASGIVLAVVSLMSRLKSRQLNIE
jgi:predicted DNA repair protein MutK